MAENCRTEKKPCEGGAEYPASIQASNATLLNLMRLLARQTATEFMAKREEDKNQE